LRRFSGTLAAIALENYDYLQVIFIDSKDYFEFTPSILRATVDPEHLANIRIPHRNYLRGEHTTIVRQEVLAVRKNEVFLRNESKVGFDFLLIACGSSYRNPFKDNNLVIPIRGETLSRSHQKLVQANSVLIIGAGIVGVELSAEIIESFPEKEVIIVHSGSNIMNRSKVPMKAIDYATQFLLKSPKVRLILNQRVIGQQGPKNFYTDKGTIIEADMAFSCTGIMNNSRMIANGELAHCLDKDGFIRVNQYLQMEAHDNILVAGDILSIQEEKLAQNAERSGYVAAMNIASLASFSFEATSRPEVYSKNNQRILHEYRLRSRTKLISLGRLDGIFTFEEFSFFGFLPAIAKEFVEWKVMSYYQRNSDRQKSNP